MGPLVPLLWLASLAPPSEVGAAAPRNARVEPAGRAQVVVVVFEGQAEALETVVRAVRAQFAGGAVGAQVIEANLPFDRLSDAAAEASRRAREASALGTFWFETTEDAVFVYLTDPPGRRVLVRRIDWQGPDDLAAAESVAVVVRSSAEALAAGSVIGMERVATEAPATTEPEPTTPRTRRTEPSTPSRAAVDRGPRRSRGVHVDLRAGYVGSNLLDRLVWQHGIGVGGDVAFARRWAIAVGYRHFFPARVRGAATTVRFDRYVPAVTAAFAPWLHPRAEVGLAAGVAGEILRRRTEADAGAAAAPSLRFVPVVVAGAELRVRFAGWLWGTVGARLEVPTIRTRYLEGAGEGGTTQVVAQMAPVRGAILVGLVARIRARADRSMTRNGRSRAP